MIAVVAHSYWAIFRTPPRPPTYRTSKNNLLTNGPRQSSVRSYRGRQGTRTFLACGHRNNVVTGVEPPRHAELLQVGDRAAFQVFT
jgi:endonuclease/exonuclease/phosphatase (EEP) superfamily protein YafD